MKIVTKTMQVTKSFKADGKEDKDVINNIQYEIQDDAGTVLGEAVVSNGTLNLYLYIAEKSIEDMNSLLEGMFKITPAEK